MTCQGGAGNPLSNERGIALVIAILLLMVITLFGALGITMSTRELRGAGNQRLDEQRFYEAQTAISETLLRPNDWLTDIYLTSPVSTATGNMNISDLVNGNALAAVTIFNIQDADPDIAALRGLPVQAHITEPPAGSGYSLGKFQARRFSVTSTTPDGRTVIREGVWRVFNK